MPIRWDKFTVKAQEAIQRANELASEHGNSELAPLHLLAALVEDREGIVAPVLEKIGIGPQAVLSELYQEIEKLPKVSGSGGPQQPSMSSQINQVLERAFKEADTFKDEYVSTEHMLLALTSLKRDPAQELLARHGATHDAILKANVRFHKAVAAATRNPLAIMVLQAISEPLVEVSRRTNEMPGVPEAGLRQHWAIYRAIRENNPEKARHAMRLHLQAAERNAHILESKDRPAVPPPPAAGATTSQSSEESA